jgi:hypothetical protein
VGEVKTAGGGVRGLGRRQEGSQREQIPRLRMAALLMHDRIVKVMTFYAIAKCM